MRISDWSSDVCSSDLAPRRRLSRTPDAETPRCAANRHAAAGHLRLHCAPMISLHTLTLRRGARTLLENATLTIYPGWRVGVIGRNGTGKSTLFAAITGELDADKGSLSLPKDRSEEHTSELQSLMRIS